LRAKPNSPVDATEQSEALKKTSEMASRYARDNADNLLRGLDSYFQERRARVGGAPPGPAPKALNLMRAEKLATDRVRGAVNVVVPPLVVREYAAPRPAPAPLRDAADSPDTILWQPVIVLPSDGKATLTFYLGDVPDGYQVVVAGHTADGRLGAVRDFIPVARARTLGPTGPVAPAGPLPPLPPAVPTAPPAPPVP
jgi:hypothetical protein